MESEEQDSYEMVSSPGGGFNLREEIKEEPPVFETTNQNYSIEIHSPDPEMGPKYGATLRRKDDCEDSFLRMNSGMLIRISANKLSTVNFHRFLIKVASKGNIFKEICEKFRSLVKISFSYCYFTATVNSWYFTSQYYYENETKCILIDCPYFHVGKGKEPTDCGFSYGSLLEGLTNISKRMPKWATERLHLMFELDKCREALKLPEDLKVPDIYVTAETLLIPDAEGNIMYKVLVKIERSCSMFHSFKEIINDPFDIENPYDTQKPLSFPDSYVEEPSQRVVSGSSLPRRNQEATQARAPQKPFIPFSNEDDDIF
ncbi:unnamed protein product [Moneuplotes crassus]|uniref:Uncharacterized protein n=1 Tax=Euplotes crassus TaxID=5936 RepID=A0AAD2D0D6_EUPCR|nr:unnamed protein product [Moneuplotes crassus]